MAGAGRARSSSSTCSGSCSTTRCGAPASAGSTNLVPTQGDATALPYDDGSIDAVVLTAVLGEIPDQAAALGEIARVLRPGGRLVVGELFGDPHFTSPARCAARRGGRASLRAPQRPRVRLLRPAGRLGSR